MLPPLSFSLLFFNYLFYSTFVFLLLLLLVFIFSFFFFFSTHFSKCPPRLSVGGRRTSLRKREKIIRDLRLRVCIGTCTCIHAGPCFVHWTGDQWSKNAERWRNGVIVSRKRNSCADFVLTFLIVVTTYYR